MLLETRSKPEHFVADIAPCCALGPNNLNDNARKYTFVKEKVFVK